MHGYDTYTNKFWTPFSYLFKTLSLLAPQFKECFVFYMIACAVGASWHAITVELYHECFSCGRMRRTFEPTTLPSLSLTFSLIPSPLGLLFHSHHVHCLLVPMQLIQTHVDKFVRCSPRNACTAQEVAIH